MFKTFGSQLSLATGNKAWASEIPDASLHCIVLFNAPAAVVQVGAVSSMMVITWVYTALAFPHASVTIHVLV
mgnify:CR=1 FL=1